MEAVELKLRTEQPADYRETENVTREAFWNLYSPGCCEHYLVAMSYVGARWYQSVSFSNLSLLASVTTERTVRC